MKGKHAKVYLFGSFATNRFSSQSDVDVLVIADDQKAARACAAVLSGDTVTITSEQFEKKRESVLFWKDVDREKEMIFEC
ncbi:MAG: nucleotidyltransferase domain-containing protein [Sedimenticola sp.]